MRNEPLPFTLDPNAKFGRRVPEMKAKKSLAEKVWVGVMYGSVIFGVGIAAFIITPAHAGQGSMAHDVKIIRVSPSVSFYGSREEQRAKAGILRDNNQHRNDMELEQLKFENDSRLIELKSYYRRLEKQKSKK